MRSGMPADEGGWLSTERRRCDRLNDHIFVSYQVDGRAGKIITHNISTGGLMFETERRLPVGTALELEIYQPTNHYKSLICVVPVIATVVWCKRLKLDFFEIGVNKYRVGVAFAKIHEDDRHQIATYITERTSG